MAKVELYQDIRRNTTLLFPTDTSLNILEELLKKYQPRGNRIYDMGIVSIALANGIPEIRTVNVKDFSGVTEISVASL
jgi:outer membrane PBP1 activator LpoA protein